MKSILTTALFLFVSSLGYGQAGSYIKLGANVPQQFALQYTQAISPKFSVSAEAGVLVAPFDGMILGTLRRLGTNEAVVDLTEQLFEGGVIGGLKGNYHIKKAYFSGFVQTMHLRGSDASRSFIRAFSSKFPKPSLRVDLHFVQVGLLAGYRFPLGKRLELHTEFAFSRTARVNTQIQNSMAESDGGLSAVVDSEIKRALKQYGYLPTLNVYFAYRIGKPMKALPRIHCPNKYW